MVFWVHSSVWAAIHFRRQLQQESQPHSVRLQLQLKPTSRPAQICLANVVVVARSQHRSNALHAPAEIVSGCSNRVTHVCDICAMLWLTTTMSLALHAGDVTATSRGVCGSESASESVTPVDDDCARHRNDVATTTKTTSVAAAAAAAATEICTSRMMLRMSCGSVRLSCRCSDSPSGDVANQFALYLFPALSPAHGPCRCRVVARRVHVHDRDPDHVPVPVRACSRSPCCSLWCDDGDDRSASEE